MTEPFSPADKEKAADSAILPAELQGLLDPGDRPEIWNPYTAYKALVTAWLERERRVGELRLERDEVAPLSVEALWRTCEAAALHLHRSGGPALYAEAPIRDDPALRSLERTSVAGRSLLIRGAAGELRFAHPSVQAFFLVSAYRRGRCRRDQLGEFSADMERFLSPDADVERLRRVSQSAPAGGA